MKLELSKFNIVANDQSKQILGHTVSSYHFAERFRGVQNDKNDLTKKVQSLLLSTLDTEITSGKTLLKKQVHVLKDLANRNMVQRSILMRLPLD